MFAKFMLGGIDWLSLINVTISEVNFEQFSAALQKLQKIVFIRLFSLT